MHRVLLIFILHHKHAKPYSKDIIPMKKGERYIGTVTRIAFPNRAVVAVDGEAETVVVKNGLPGQKVEFVVSKKRNGRCEGR